VGSAVSTAGLQTTEKRDISCLRRELAKSLKRNVSDFYFAGFLLYKNLQILKTNVLTAKGTNTSKYLYTESPYWCISHHHHYHNHKHQGLGHLARSVSRVTAALANVSSVSQLFSFLVDCSGMILKGFGFVAFFAGVKTSFFCINLSCLSYLCNVEAK
jgi:hypothetical protein